MSRFSSIVARWTISGWPHRYSFTSISTVRRDADRKRRTSCSATCLNRVSNPRYRVQRQEKFVTMAEIEAGSDPRVSASYALLVEGRTILGSEVEHLAVVCRWGAG